MINTPRRVFLTLRPLVRLASVAAYVQRHPALSVFLIGLSLRLATVVAMGDVVYDTGGDAVRYLSIARDILAERPYGSTSGDTTRVPLYQLFLAGHLWLFGERLVTVAVSQAFIGAATAVVLMWTARELAGLRAGLLAGLLWATYPSSILNVVVLFPQTLQVLWLAAAFWLVVVGVMRRSLAACAAAAACWGVSCMTRSGNLLFMPVFVLSPVLLWRLRVGASWRWSAAAVVVMSVVGVLSVVWWTARDFTLTYRFEYLLLNGHERDAVRLLLRPVEPWHAAMANALLERSRGEPRRAAGAARTAKRPSARPARVATAPAPRVARTPVVPIVTVSAFNPRELDPKVSAAHRSDVLKNVERERRRYRTKLWQALGAPDGSVQLGCTGPPQGYWALFKAEATSNPLRVALVAVSRPCMALKALMYVQHYLLLGLLIPGSVVLVRRAPGLATLLCLYVTYTTIGVVFASNYSEALAAVPRYAFSLMPVVILLVGLWSPFASNFLSREAPPVRGPVTA